MQLRSSFEAKVLFAFGMAILVVAGLCAITWTIVGDVAVAAEQVLRTQRVLQGLAYARAAITQIELSTQNFRISGDQAHLDARDQAIERREHVLQTVRQLTAESAAQQTRWLELQAVIQQRIEMSREIETLRKSQGQAAADAYVAKAPLQETRARAHRLLDVMEDDESKRLEARIVTQQELGHRLRIAGTLVAILLLAMLSATYGLIRRQLRRAQVGRLQLEDSEERLAITLRSITDAVMATDTDGRVTRMNPVAERLSGWAVADALGQPVDLVCRLLCEGSHAPMPGEVAAVLANGEIRQIDHDLLLLGRDGVERQIALGISPKRDLSGRMRGAVLVFRDVTLERRAQLTIEAQNRWLAQRVEARTAELRQSEAHLRSVTSNVPALIAYVDEHQRYVYVNQQYHERFAPERATLVDCTVEEILGESRYAIAAPMIAKVLQGEAQSYDWQPFPGIWQAINYVPQRDAHEHVVGYYVLGSDITERKRSENHIQLLNSELEQRVRELERVSRALRTLSAGNRALLRAQDEGELLQSMCDAIVTVGGYGRAIVWYRIEDEAKTLRPMAERGDPAGLRALRELTVSWGDGDFNGGAASRSVRAEETVIVDDMSTSAGYAPWRSHLGGQRSAFSRPLRVDGKVIGALAIYDVEPHVFDDAEVALLDESADDLAFGIATLRARAEQQRVAEALHRLTHFDALTGLPNEAQFAEALDAAIEHGRRTGQPFSALQINIDRLREVNDALGFSQGDRLLREFAARLRSAAPEPALVARLRGDEFAILMPAGDRGTATSLSRQLSRVLADPFLIADIPLDVLSRTGLVLYPEHGETPHDFFRHMDIAVQQAKQRGLRQAFFDPLTHQDQPERLNMASALRRGIEGDELRLYLQPKVDMASGRVCGAEALVRWQHPERGLVPPMEFIALAEHTGLIKPLTEWMLTAALQQNRVWMTEGRALPIAVNLSARNLRDADLLEQISQMLVDFDVIPGLLELEITESTVMDDAEFALGVLHALRDMGIPLYVDDFGTGYSSLSYLQRLPVEYIKIDQAFVRDMLNSRDSATIVRSTIDLVHDLGRKIVAEGIETIEHWHQLKKLGCDMAQGYFIAKPMPAADFQAWIHAFEAPSAK